MKIFWCTSLGGYSNSPQNHHCTVTAVLVDGLAGLCFSSADVCPSLPCLRTETDSVGVVDTGRTGTQESDANCFARGDDIRCNRTQVKYETSDKNILNFYNRQRLGYNFHDYCCIIYFTIYLLFQMLQCYPKTFVGRSEKKKNEVTKKIISLQKMRKEALFYKGYGIFMVSY